MAGTSRFHDKIHRANHHSVATPGLPDSAGDPIASQDNPFRGEFVLSGALSALGGGDFSSLQSRGTMLAQGATTLASTLYVNDATTLRSELLLNNAGGVITTDVYPVTSNAGSATLSLNFNKGVYINGTFGSAPKLVLGSPGIDAGTLSVTNISATNLYGTLDGDSVTGSVKWNSVYNSSTAVSASWDSVHTTVYVNSAAWNAAAGGPIELELNTLLDVEVSAPVINSQLLVYNESLSTWENTSYYSDVVSALSSTLSSVVATVDGSSASWDDTYTAVSSNSSNWSSVYSSVASASATWSTITALSTLDDVLVTSPINNQILQYNSSIGQWVNDDKLSSTSTITASDINLTSAVVSSFETTPLTASGEFLVLTINGVARKLQLWD